MQDQPHDGSNNNDHHLHDGMAANAMRRSGDQPGIGENEHARAQSSNDIEEPTADPAVIDLTQMGSPTISNAGGTSFSNIPRSSAQDINGPSLDVAVTILDACPTWRAATPAQIATTSQLQVINELGHIRRTTLIPTEVHHEIPFSPASIDNNLTADLSNLYRMPGTDIISDARQHNPAPFQFVDPSLLDQPWVSVVEGDELRGEIAAMDSDASGHRREHPDVARAHGLGNQQLQPAGPMASVEGPPASALGPMADVGGAAAAAQMSTQPPRILPSQPGTPDQPIISGFSAEPITQLPALQTPHITPDAIGIYTSDEQLRARIQTLTRLIATEIQRHGHILDAIIAANPWWHDQPYDARYHHRLQLWGNQVRTFERAFLARNDLDPQALAASIPRFDNDPMSRMRLLIETQMRAVNGLPQGELSLRREMRLRMNVLEAQLRTLQAWTADWTRSLP